VFTEDSRVFASVAATPHTTGSEPRSEARLIVTRVRTKNGKLLLGVLVGGERPVRPHVDILVVNP
jgi:hypothetical protein